MEVLNLILGLVPGLYNCTCKHTAYIRDLEKNLQALANEMVKLNNRYADVKARVDRAEQQQMRRRKEVGGWISEVEDMVDEVGKFLQKGNREIQKRCLRCCPRNCWSRYKIGKAVSKKLSAVSRQISEGHFDVVAYMLPRPPVDELPVEETVGLELTYDRICSCLKDPQVGIMGLYGIGGAGKTTLLKKINNDFLANTDFDVVIWAVVSKPSNVERIQQSIWNKLEIPLNTWETRSSMEEKAAEILRVLKTKKFVLLLDDIWETLNLKEVGVPDPDAQNKSKIVFTTRSKDVCREMKAHENGMEVGRLSSEAAWTLFRKEVGEETLNSHPDIPQLARVLADECKGLPLTLIIVGRPMRSKKDPKDWDTAIRYMRKSPGEIKGMEDELFYRLKLSYDRLSNNVVKSCFIFCSMFPEDWEIYNYDLIEYWIGEGFLGQVHDIHDARYRGHEIIEELKHACLLESCGSREKRVKMHDVIHSMALWLYHKLGMEQNKIVVYNEVARLIEAREISKLEDAEKMFLWDMNVEEFPKTLKCPNLKTLFVHSCHKLKKFPSGFFQFMPLIILLDLSQNDNLSELPTGIDKLSALRSLNLSYTRIRKLPIQLKKMKNLMILRLDGMRSLLVIPQAVISSLISLKLFSMCGTNISSGVEKTLLDELESLDGISEICITISTSLSFNKLKSSHKLQNCTSHLQLRKLGDMITLELSSSFLKRMGHLQRLRISHCDELEDVKINVEGEGIRNDVTLPNYVVAREEYFHSLHRVNIRHCSKLLDLTWLVYAPNLELLYIEECDSIEQVIRDDCAVYEIKEKLNIFSRLKYLKLNRLPRLKSINQYPLHFPSLEIIKVYECKSLRSLPFDSNTSNNNLKKIKGETGWWNQLKWNDETVKQSFNLYFQIHEAEAYLTNFEESEVGGIDDMQEQLISN